MIDYIEKTLMDLSKYFRAVYFSEDFSSRNGFIQKVNPPIAFLVLISFIFLSILVHDIFILIILYTISISLIVLSRIPLSYYIKSIAFIPLFTAIIALPYIFYPFSQPPFIYKFSFIGITYQGLRYSSILILRVTIAVSFMIIIYYGIGFQRLIGSLKVLKIPDIFLNMISFTYRYIFLIVSQVYDIFLSRKSKMCKSNKKIGRKWQSYLLGHIFVRSSVLSENMYNSMVSRGYTGEIVPMKKNKSMQYNDIFFLAFFILIIIIAFVHG
jgi:cobalt/nickel transport system permease protein